MTKAEMLTLLKQAVGEPNATLDRATFLEMKLDSAIQRLKNNGIDIDESTSDYSIDDSDLIVTYAEFLVRKRDTQDGMPRSLEWAIHNRIMVQNGAENV